MKNLITSILFFTPFLLIGQMQSSIDLGAGIHFSNRTIQSPIDDEIFSEVNRYPVRMNWSSGIYYNVRVGRNLHLKSGLRIASLGYTGLELSDLVWSGQIQEEQDIYSHIFIEVPVLMRYEFKAKSLALYLESGITPSYYATTRAKQITNLENSPTIEYFQWPDYRRVQLSANIALGLNFNVTSNIQLYTQPVFIYHLLNSTHIIAGFHPAGDAGQIKEHLYAFGLEAGARKRLGG